MAPPPDRLRAHESDTVTNAKLNNFSESGPEIVTEGIVCVVMETLDPPKSVDGVVHSLLFWSSSP
jgi:hypothetical protein